MAEPQASTVAREPFDWRCDADAVRRKLDRDRWSGVEVVEIIATNMRPANGGPPYRVRMVGVALADGTITHYARQNRAGAVTLTAFKGSYIMGDPVAADLLPEPPA